MAKLGQCKHIRNMEIKVLIFFYQPKARIRVIQLTSIIELIDKIKSLCHLHYHNLHKRRKEETFERCFALNDPECCDFYERPGFSILETSDSSCSAQPALAPSQKL